MFFNDFNRRGSVSDIWEDIIYIHNLATLTKNYQINYRLSDEFNIFSNNNNRRLLRYGLSKGTTYQPNRRQVPNSKQ